MNIPVFIYGLVDPKTNELRYVGKSVNPLVRLRKHISERNVHDTYKDRWLRKLYDLNIKPELIIIDEVKHNQWQFWERFYINYFKSIGCSLTNTTIGGDEPPSTKGRKHTDETRKKMSESKKGKPIPWLNKKRTKEHQNNLTKALKGRKSEKKGKTYDELYGNRSQELKNKLSKAHCGIQAGNKHPMYNKKHTEETKNKIAKKFNKVVIQFDLSGSFIKEWESIKSAQDNLKIKNISNACKGKYKTAGGFIWKYKLQ